ncbi:MAG: hypothetical protein KDA20_03470 [Phycisphaerales bacterium]|nr:hypothetical protein [Phycisphaerales bacterium]
MSGTPARGICSVVLVCVGAGALCAAPLANAGELYRNQMNSSAGWGMNVTNADVLATFGFNYGAIGIPEAPNSRGGDAATRGVKLEANTGEPAESAEMNLFPIGQSFSGDYRLRFDAWMSFDVTGGQIGSTEFLGGGIGYDSATAGIGSGVQMIATGDGGSGSDWRAFKDSFFLTQDAMVAGSRNAADPYYTNFLPGVAPPVGSGQPAIAGFDGSPAFQWVTWQFTVYGDMVDIGIIKPNGDQRLIARIDVTDISDGSSGATRDGNIMLYYGDIFTSVSPAPQFTFGLIDNVLVTTEIPAPGAIALLGVASPIAVRRRRRR